MASGSALTNLGTAVTFLAGQFSTMISTITDEPLLLLPVGIFVFGAVIGLAMRLIRG